MLQNKNEDKKKFLLFLSVLIIIGLTLTGCNWFANGLLGILDPWAAIRLNFTEIDLTESEGTIDLEIYSINEVEFIGEGFSYKYYNNGVLIPKLSKTVGMVFYVAPSDSPGTPGDTTEILDLPLYYQEVLDYAGMNPMITEITCTISLIGTDGAGHDITKSVTVDLPGVQPGVDFAPPIAKIATTPESPIGNPPLLVIFDASGSTDNRGIASYSWNFGDGSSSSEAVASHTFVEAGTFIVILTVTDYFGNSDIDTKVITVGVGEVGAVIVTTPSPATGFVPFTVGFNASGSTVSAPPITNYAWDFDGDGTTDATGITAVHEFSTVGTYLVQLTVTDSAANEYVTFVTVIANDEP